jgi:predicted O-methyltransferase YrrM
MLPRVLDILRRTRAEIHQSHLLITEMRAMLSAALQDRARPGTWVPPGHFYSPIVDPAEIEPRRHSIFNRDAEVAGVALNAAGQLEMLQRIGRHARALPFQAEAQDGLRYHYNNPNFSYGDAIVLAGLLMELRPRRVVEVGSGFSSCVTLDVDERFLGGQTEITFVEPYPDLLLGLMRPGDRARCRIIRSIVQALDLAVVETLAAGDVLFIDSTHVSKCGSDVNFELFQILPRLKPGVLVHFHDVFWPFEYPEQWIFEENRSWNELYLLRAFLTNNPEYEIVFFNHYMALQHRAAMEREIPLALRNPGGGLWLRKLAR